MCLPAPFHTHVIEWELYISTILSVQISYSQAGRLRRARIAAPAGVTQQNPGNNTFPAPIHTKASLKRFKSEISGRYPIVLFRFRNQKSNCSRIPFGKIFGVPLRLPESNRPSWEWITANNTLSSAIIISQWYSAFTIKISNNNRPTRLCYPRNVILNKRRYHNNLFNSSPLKQLFQCLYYNKHVGFHVVMSAVKTLAKMAGFDNNFIHGSDVCEIITEICYLQLCV